MILFRPVGLDELSLVYDLEFKAFPPRLPEQPIFYPVLNFEYAAQIARDWNTKSSSHAGYVTRFEIDDAYANSFEPRTVGASNHAELWVPSGELEIFNTHIVGEIAAIAAYFGEMFEGCIPNRFGLKDKTANEQFKALANTLDYSSFDFYCEVSVNRKAVFLNFPYWKQNDFSEDGVEENQKVKTLVAIQDAWKMAAISFHLI